MPLFGSSRDFNYIKSINDEYIKKIVEQKIGYFKINNQLTDGNIYGESLNKIYNNPILIDCIISNLPQTSDVQVGLPTVNRNITFNFFREHLVEINLFPEKGDIILWQNDYFEVYNVIENEYFVGKIPDYSYSTDTDNYGGSISIKLEAIYINPEKLPFKIERI
jgi:hypothetical protein